MLNCDITIKTGALNDISSLNVEIHNTTVTRLEITFLMAGYRMHDYMAAFLAAVQHGDGEEAGRIIGQWYQDSLANA